MLPLFHQRPTVYWLLASLLITAAAAQAGQSLQREFFVAPGGSDTNPGTQAKPFQSLERARDAVRPLLAGMTGDIAVTIRDGIYPVRETVVFGAQDSATGIHRIRYRATAGEKPVFTGGVAVTGWTPYQNGIWKAPLQRNTKLRALYVDGTRAVMAHSGKIRAQGGWGTYTVSAGQAPWAWQSGQTADGIRYNLGDLPVIRRNPEDVEIENETTWNKNFIGVRDITCDGGQFIFKLQEPYGAIAQQIGWAAGLTLNSEQIIHNAFELLDQPGEFYFDRAAQTVYYIPLPGQDMTRARVIAPVTETLLRIEGTLPDRLVRNLTFEGLTFAHTDYNLMEIDGSHGKATSQTATVCTAFANSNWHLDAYRAYDVLPGAVIANGVEGFEFIGNTITHTGCEGLVMSNAVRDSQVVGNVIRDAGGSAISLGHPQHIYENDTPDLKYAEGAGVEHEKYPPPTEAIPRRVRIANNFLPDNAVLFNGHTIITVFFASDVAIEHNWIPNAPYSGMNVGWGWCDFDGSDGLNHPFWGKGARPAVLPEKPTLVAGFNSILGNRVENCMSILHDGGAIYTLGRMPGTIIERNYVHRSGNHGIYTDEGSAFITCRDNVINGFRGNAHFADNYGRKHSIIVDHYFVSEDRFGVEAADSEVTHTVVGSPETWPQEARNIMEESGLQPEWRWIVPKDWQPRPETAPMPRYGYTAGGWSGLKLVALP